MEPDSPCSNVPALQTEGTKENCVSSEKWHLIILCLMVSMTRALLRSCVDLSRTQVPASLLSLHFCFSEVCPGCTPLPIALWPHRGHLQTALLHSECFLWGAGVFSEQRDVYPCSWGAQTARQSVPPWRAGVRGQIIQVPSQVKCQASQQ